LVFAICGSRNNQLTDPGFLARQPRAGMTKGDRARIEVTSDCQHWRQRSCVWPRAKW
jgi:hypothetical protein